MEQHPNGENENKYVKITSLTKRSANGEEATYTKEETLTGEAAKMVAAAMATVEEEKGKTAIEGFRGILNALRELSKRHGNKIAFGVMLIAGWKFLDKSDTSTTPASGGTITTDAKVPGNDNIPGNGSGAA